MECIILAGGLGTRLQGVIGGYPKCMAPVNDKPFLQYIFHYLELQGCTRVILSLGYKHEVVLDWLMIHKPAFVVDHVLEYEPLGTGGGIQLAMQEAREAEVVVLNGDTMFQSDINAQLAFHKANNAAATLALKQMHDFDRYGVVNTDGNDVVTSFDEKQYRKEGFINGGVYIIDRQYFLDKHLPEKYSFEKDFLEQFVVEQKFYGYKSDAYFIDIGIPADYAQSQLDFKILFA